MKKKILFALLALFISASALAQFSCVPYKSDEYAQLKASKTYIILTGDERFDKELVVAMRDLWKLTAVDVLAPKEIDKKIQDKKCSFILSATAGGYAVLALINGGKKKLEDYSFTNMIAYAPINAFQNESNNSDCYYRVRNMVESMQHAMALVQKNDIKGNQIKIGNKLIDIYNTRAQRIKKRTLLFCEESLGTKLTKSDIAGMYPYKFEFCDKEKIEQVIKEKSTEYYYFMPTITVNKFFFVFDPSNGEVVYADAVMTGMNINKNNIKDLIKKVKGD
jgi:hypothetical protein